MTHGGEEQGERTGLVTSPPCSPWEKELGHSHLSNGTHPQSNQRREKTVPLQPGLRLGAPPPSGCGDSTCSCPSTAPQHSGTHQPHVERPHGPSSACHARCTAQHQSAGGHRGGAAEVIAVTALTPLQREASNWAWLQMAHGLFQTRTAPMPTRSFKPTEASLSVITIPQVN